MSPTPAAARVDVETLLLCDVLPDGTVAGLVLVEPVYDTSSGARVATRTVDPTTGVAYTVQGTLQQCPESSDCPDCQTFILCDTAAVTTSTAPVTVTGYQVRNDQLISGAPRRGTDADAAAIWTGQTVSVPGAAPGGSDGGAHTHYGVIVSLGDAACGDLDPAGTVDLTATVTYTNDGPGGGWDWYGRLSMWNGTTLLPGVDNFGQGSGVFFTPGSTRTATITNTVPVAAVLAGDVTIEFDLETGPDQQPDAKTWTVTAGAVTAGPVPVTGCPGTPTQFMRHLCRDCDGTATITDTTLDGTTLYTVAGTVGQCDTETPCASPTEPTATVGLCLADGTPIAVTVVRDCTGTVTSEGWLNLTSGAYSAGAPPAGTVACGDSRSIQVSGTFCDIDPATGDVLGLVLIEYTYDDTGAIASVRLVDAVTGGTYTPTGTVTTCPAGVEQPEQDAVVLCDTAADGTVTEFLRDFRRDENGAITGHSDYLLDGTAYTPTGTVGVCSSPCLTCETVQLCDVTPGPGEWATVQGQATPETLANGVTVTWTRNIPAGGVYPDTNMRSWLPTAASLTSTLSTSKPAQIRIGVSLAHDQTLTLPPGAEVLSLSSHHTYAPATRILTADATSTMSGDTSGGANAGDYITYIYLPRVANSVDFTASVTGGAIGFDNIEAAPAQPYPFLRTVCRGCDGTVTSTTDTELDGTTAYTVLGTASTCEPTDCQHCETLLLCDDGADTEATITGAAASGSLSNGVTWTATNTAGTQAMPPAYNNSDGSWWGLHIFPNPSVAPTKWTFSRPSVVEFSVYLHFNAVNSSLNTAQLPAGLDVVHLPTGYSYDASTGVLTRTSDTTPAEPCSYVTDPQVETSARFRTASAVTQFTTAPPPNSRIALCGRFFDYWVGAVSATPSGQFLRTICRDCDGAVTRTTDTALDGVTPYTLIGAVRQCADSGASQPQYDIEPLLLCDTAADGTVTEFLRHYVYDAATGALTDHRDTTLDGQTAYAPTGAVGQCQPAECELTPICVRPSGRVEFLSNPGAATSGVDADWTWGQSLAGPWFPTYRVGVYPGWTTVDPGTAEGTAHWIAPHPDSQLANTGLPGEGPAITAGTPDWYGRASFQLPSFADPATIRISATALNADQVAVEWRLNGGAWQTVNSNHTAPPYTLAPTAVPGAQAGVNEIVVHVRETVFPTGAAGILLHVIAEYDVDASAYLEWTQVVCTDGEMYYLDDLGVRQDALPDGATVVPCPGANESCTKQVIERCGCDDTDGDGTGDVTYTELWAVDPCDGAAPTLLGTYLDGDLTQPYAPVAPVECTAADALPGPVLTGVRNVTGIANQQLAAEFSGLQSVTLTVLSGFVAVTMSSGANVTIPAGVTMTWSVAKDDDTTLDHATFVGTTAAANYLLNWTYR
jgi:hypothetical protein